MVLEIDEGSAVSVGYEAECKANPWQELPWKQARRPRQGPDKSITNLRL
jgi:hypothetical protein